MATTFKNPLRRIAAVATALVAAAGLMLAASPAHAASATLIHPEWIDGCPGCPGPVDLQLAVRAELQSDVAVQVGDLVARGTQILVEAARSEPSPDPWRSDRLVVAGVASFAEASAMAGNAGFMVAEDWDGDWCGNRPKPWPWPKDDARFVRVDELLADGLTTLGEAAIQRDGDAQQALEDRAVGSLQEAAMELSAG